MFHRFASLAAIVSLFGLGWSLNVLSPSKGVRISSVEFEEGENPRLVLTLKNQSWRDIQVTGATTDCSCIASTGFPRSVPKFDSVKLCFNVVRTATSRSEQTVRLNTNPPIPRLIADVQIPPAPDSEPVVTDLIPSADPMFQ